METMIIQLDKWKIGTRLFTLVVTSLIALILISTVAFAASSAAPRADESGNFPAVGELFELGNKVWLDANGNAQFDAEEQGVPNIQITLLDDFGNPYDIDPTLAGVQGYSTTTDANGNYLFTSLITNTYRISIDAVNFQSGGALEGYAAVEPASSTPDDNIDSDSNGVQVGSLDANGLMSGSINLNVTNNPTFINRTVDFGFYTLTLGNRVWEDRNNNGVYDPQREQGMPNITVNLLDSSGSVMDTTLTDSGGLYTFTNIVSGTYIVEVFPPSGYFSSTGDGEEGNPASNGDENDNGSNLLIGGAIQSDAFTLIPGDAGAQSNNLIINSTGTTINPTIDFGLWKFMNLGHIVWQDTNNNGTIDPTESGIDGITVELYRDDGDGILDIRADTLAGSQVTANGGYYGFNQLATGNYFVHIPRPSSSYPSSSLPLGSDDVGLQSISGDATSSQMIILERDPNADDADGTNGTESKMNVNFGFFAPISIGNMVWYDYEQDGLQVARDDGVPSTDVFLYDTIDNIVAAITTDSNGRYEFENIAPGDYYLVFEPPNGYNISPQDVGGNDMLDSDADPATGRTPIFTANASTTNDKWDVGVYIPTQLGNYVWHDTDGDGIQGSDPSETPLANILVEILDTTGNLVTQTTTSSTGEYLFSGIIPGDYLVQFTPPAGLIPVLPDQGSDDTKDSDISFTGYNVQTTLTSGENDRKIDAGFSEAASLGGFTWFDSDGDGIQGTDPNETPIAGIKVSLFDANNIFIAETTTDSNGSYSFNGIPPGQYFTEFEPTVGRVFVPANTGGDDNLDSDVDPTGVTEIIRLAPGSTITNNSGGLYETTSIGNYVWHDTNADGIQGPVAEEEPMPNVSVLLYDGNGILVAQTATDQNGFYQFVELNPGEYYLEVVPPSGYVITSPDKGDDENDSDADRSTGQTPVTILLPAENDSTWDFGLLTPAELREGPDGGDPNAITLSYFTVQEGPSGSKTMVIEWETSAEIDTLGYYILRSRDDGFRSARTISPYMVESQGTQGGSYMLSLPYNSVVDPALSIFTFWLVELEVSGRTSHFKAAMLEGQSAGNGYQVYLPMLSK